MKNKTCGECSWFSEGGNRCKLFINQYIFGDRAACNNFVAKKPTNGEKIWQSGYDAVITFAKTWMEKFSCWAEAEEWLNAPAGCVAENGKSAKQADLCCKSAKESEGEDE